MKKAYIIVLAFLTIFSTATFGSSFGNSDANADVESTFRQGDKVLSFGLGLGSTLYRGSWYKTTIPPISASLEMGVMDDFIVEDLTLGVGGYLGFSSSKYRYTGFGTDWGWDYTYIIVGGRAAAHYPLVEKLDTYTGLMLGFNITSSKSYGTVTGNASSGGLVYSWFAGGRYYVSDNFAVMAELGYGIAYLTLGVSLKLPGASGN